MGIEGPLQKKTIYEGIRIITYPHILLHKFDQVLELDVSLASRDAPEIFWLDEIVLAMGGIGEAHRLWVCELAEWAGSEFMR